MCVCTIFQDFEGFNKLYHISCVLLRDGLRHTCNLHKKPIVAQGSLCFGSPSDWFENRAQTMACSSHARDTVSQSAENASVAASQRADKIRRRWNASSEMKLRRPASASGCAENATVTASQPDEKNAGFCSSMRKRPSSNFEMMLRRPASASGCAENASVAVSRRAQNSPGLCTNMRKRPSANFETNLRRPASASGVVVQRAETRAGLDNSSTERADKIMEELLRCEYNMRNFFSDQRSWRPQHSTDCRNRGVEDSTEVPGRRNLLERNLQRAMKLRRKPRH